MRRASPGVAKARSGNTTRRRRTLRAIFVAGSQQVGDNIDNITASPRGGLLLCENGDAIVDEYGQGTRLIGITAEGDSYAFAKNNIDLALEDTVGAGKRIEPDYYRTAEWAGACFDPSGRGAVRQYPGPGHHLRDLGTLGAWQPLGSTRHLLGHPLRILSTDFGKGVPCSVNCDPRFVVS